MKDYLLRCRRDYFGPKAYDKEYFGPVRNMYKSIAGFFEGDCLELDVHHPDYPNVKMFRVWETGKDNASYAIYFENGNSVNLDLGTAMAYDWPEVVHDILCQSVKALWDGGYEIKSWPYYDKMIAPCEYHRRESR